MLTKLSLPLLSLLIFITIIFIILTDKMYKRIYGKYEHLTSNDIVVDNKNNINQALMNIMTQNNLLKSQIEKNRNEINNLSNKVKVIKTTIGQIDKKILKNGVDIKQINSILDQIGEASQSE